MGIWRRRGAVWWHLTSILLLDDFYSPGSLLSLLPGLHSSPTGFNLSGWGCQNKNSGRVIVLLLTQQTSTVCLVCVTCCGTHRLLSAFWIHPFVCILCIWPGASSLQIQSIKSNHHPTCKDWALIINSWCALTQLVFTFLESILCGVKSPRMTDEYFGAATKGKRWNMCSVTRCFLSVFVSALSVGSAVLLTVPFCTHLASSPDVEPALPLHRQALLSSEARWLGTGVYICQTQQTTSSTCLKCAAEELLKPRFLIWLTDSVLLRTSLGRRRIYVCTQSRLVWLWGAPSGPGTSPGAWSVPHQTDLYYMRENPIQTSAILLLI